ncbi:MAG: lipopolysaccharide heptosyltransferase II [Candidatus Zixiibacteriota bacterium]
MPLKVLIRTPNHLGDCIMALPMISEAGEAYRGASITLLTPQHLADLFETNPGIDAIIRIPSDYVHGLIAVVKIRDLVASGEYDIGYILPPSFGSAAAFKLAGVKERIGYIADGRRLLLSRPLAPPTPLNSEHRSELYFNLLRRGAGVELEYTRPKLFLNDDDTLRARDILARFGVSPGDPYAVLAFRAVAESRRWGTENYTELTKALVARHDLKVVLIGSEADRPEGDRIAAAADSGQAVNLAGKTGLRVSAAVLAGARFFVGNDSGPAHLAAAVGIPIIVLSGADNPKATSPVTPHKRLIYLEHLDCISCEKNKCPLSGDSSMQCMRHITLEMVLAVVEELVGRV